MKTVVIHSGGLDSTVLLCHLLAQGHDLLALSVDYGQRHRRELASAAAVCERLGVPHTVTELGALRDLLGGSSLTSDAVDVPEGHYAENSMKATVVPNRNMILLALATGHALTQGAVAVGYAAHSGDHTIYPDCRPAFADAMAAAMRLADWTPVELLRPFIDWTKADIVRRGTELGAPLDLTWSCYKGGELHCGRCGTCVERREAFDLAGIADPTVYDVRAGDSGEEG